MARPLRVDIRDGVYHVITRGIDRSAIFRCDQDRKHWLDLMAEARVRFRLCILARRYCGMSLKEIGEAPGGVDYAAVSDRIRRYEKKGKRAAMEQGIGNILNLEI